MIIHTIYISKLYFKMDYSDLPVSNGAVVSAIWDLPLDLLSLRMKEFERPLQRLSDPTRVFPVSILKDPVEPTRTKRSVQSE